MKTTFRRGLSLLLTLLLCLQVFSGIPMDVQAATVDYVYSGNYILNWGTREEDATFLSPKAEAFYTTGYTYEELSTLSGSSTTNASGSALYAKLKSLMSSRHTHETSYGETRYQYLYTDCQDNNTYNMTCFYSGKVIGPDWDSGSTWNREHTWPNSKGLGGNDENDIMMLRPTSSSVNSARGNKAYGEGGSYYNPNSASGGAHDLRGDVARIALYVYVRWGNTNIWGVDGVIESRDVLLKWMEADPVDTWELGRNDSVQSITGTRNVFVDYPEYAFLLFNQQIPDMVTPSGKAQASQYDINVTVNNSAWGSASLSGTTINASPATGYTVVGYTVVSGNASVTQNGNTFSVSAGSDCTICINFAAKESVKIGFVENGVTAATQTYYVGDTLSLPDLSGDAPEGYTFLGWVEENVQETAIAPVYHDIGSSLIASENTTFHALYCRSTQDITSEDGYYALYDGQITPGCYVIVSDAAAMPARLEKERFSLDAMEIVDDAVANAEVGNIWNIRRHADGSWLLYNEETETYAASKGANKAALPATVTDAAKWDISGTGSYTIENILNRTNGVAYTLRRNANNGFAPYAATTGTGIRLYRQTYGALLYSTSTTVCAHENIESAEGFAANCFISGYTAGTFCSDCNCYIEGHTPVTATHNYETLVVAPTQYQQGYTAHICTQCDDTVYTDYVDALGSIHNVRFAVPEGVAPLDAMMCGSNGIVLPEAADLDSDKQYTFLGWAAQSLSETTEMPEIYEAGDTYYAYSDTVLYALYSYSTGSSAGDWALVTSADQLVDGVHVVIAAAGYDYAAGAQSGNYRTQVAITKSGNTITIPSDVSVFTLKASSAVSGTYAFYDPSAAAYLCAVSSSSNNMKTQTSLDANGSFSIVPNADGSCTVAAQGSYTRNLIMYNKTSPRFSCYSSTSNQHPVSLYVMQPATGDTYYTTLGSGFPLASFNGTQYQSVQAALDDAEDLGGGTVTLLCNVTEEEILVPNGVTLDLQGHDLYTTIFVSYGFTVDSGETAGLLQGDELLLNEENPCVALYDPWAGGYYLYSYTLSSRGVRNTGDAVVFGFSIVFENADAYAMMAEGYCDLNLGFTLSWGDDETQTFSCSTELMQEYAALQLEYPELMAALLLNVTGTESLPSGTSVHVTPYMTNELGACADGVSIDYTV